MTHDADVVDSNRFVPAGRIVTVAQDDWRASLELHGEFDAANSDDLRQVLDAHLDAGRRVLRIDTSDVQFMDSTAIGALVHVHSRCADQHGSLIITGVGKRISRLFEITGLDHVLLIDTATSGEGTRVGD
jgi:anti-sigma B factor antagonist